MPKDGAHVRCSSIKGVDQMTKQKPPKELDAIADVVLAYRPKPRTKPAKKAAADAETHNCGAGIQRRQAPSEQQRLRLRLGFHHDFGPMNKVNPISGGNFELSVARER